jgi:hypothetical protein
MGSDSSLPATTTGKFTSGSKTTARLQGAYRKRHGITYFKSYKKVGAVFTTSPSEASRAVVAHLLQRFRHGHWHSVQKLTGAENSNGARVYLTSAPKHVRMRVELKAKADQFSRGSSATTSTFEIG